MATTTNFGWETPDDTDLVKDGALAMRTLGNAIDASLVDLKGGTTGQVLSKTSNTDMDFTWVTSDDANAIQNAIVDAKGDLITATANDTPARLAVGNNGETLVADSSASTGLRWQAPVAVNPVVNGGLDIWQRGTSFTSFPNTSTFCADRFYAYRSSLGSGLTISRQSSGLTGIQYSMRIARDSGDSSTSQIQVVQDIESANSYAFAGKTITFSFYAKAGANYSASSSGLGYVLASGTGTDQRLGSGYTGAVTLINNTATLTTSWQRFTATVAVGSTATQLGFYFVFIPTGTAGANDWVEITGIQIEVGSVATPFRRAGGTLAGELAAASRYYYRTTGGTSSRFGVGQCQTTTQGEAHISFPVTMRIAPTALEQSGTAGDYKVTNNAGSGLTNTAVPTFSTATPNGAAVNFTVGSGLTAGNATLFFATSSAAYLGWSAEL